MATSQASPAVEAFWSYTKSFESLDPGAIPRHFNEPALMITPLGVHVLPNAAAVEQAYARVMADARAQQYARTEFSTVTERSLSDGLSIVAGSGIWVDPIGRKFRPFGMTYTLRRTEGRWRIVAAFIHDPI
jgi:hypothetical protein